MNVLMSGSGARTVWGPLVWNFLHKIAAISDRQDVYHLWNNMLRVTAAILPCEQCRLHMKEYLNTHSFVPKNWMKQSGTENASQIQTWMHTFHNSVNERLGKPLVPFSEMKHGTREECLQQAQQSYKQLLTLWSNHKSLLAEWRRIVSMLIQLVSSGPT